ncbi:hypothetical protein NSS70_06745 [Aeribacillus sp. FSL K6-2848]|uniref:hypothetical protein n=1 Tax=Aeribacillus sp. FSL K6-2848 TaxID=2954612 RepID=UPI0030F61665
MIAHDYYSKINYEQEINISSFKETSKIFEAFQNYRLDRINNLAIDFEQFQEAFKNNAREAFETLFQQGVTDNLFAKIMENLTSKKHTLEKYYKYLNRLHLNGQ